MKTDENYIYPESAEELAMFYGCNCQNLNGLNVWHDYGVVSDETMKRQLDGIWPRFRIPLPTINDLKVGDVVRTSTGGYRKIYNEMELYCLKHDIGYTPNEMWGLVIGRNTWVPVKCD